MIAPCLRVHVPSTLQPRFSYKDLAKSLALFGKSMTMNVIMVVIVKVTTCTMHKPRMALQLRCRWTIIGIQSQAVADERSSCGREEDGYLLAPTTRVFSMSLLTRRAMRTYEDEENVAAFDHRGGGGGKKVRKMHSQSGAAWIHCAISQ